MNGTRLKTRIIPILLLRNGILVRARKFSLYQVTGDPFTQVERFNSWNVDELIYLDISRSWQFSVDQTNYVIGRTSSNKHHIDKKPKNMYQFIEFLSKRCFMPLTFGGGIKSIDQIKRILASGSDKVVINSQAFKAPEFISTAAKAFGSQCIVVSIDCKKTETGYEVFIEGGKTATGMKPLEWAKTAEKQGAGELLINSIDRDGTGMGYDHELYKPIIDECKIPVIICGGVGKADDFSDGYRALKPSALAAANIFHFIEHSDRKIKKHLLNNDVNVRLDGMPLAVR